MIKTLLNRLPFLNINNHPSAMVGLVVQHLQITAVCLVQTQQQWVVGQKVNQKFQNETDLFSAIADCLQQFNKYQGQSSVVLPSHMYQLVQMDKPQLSELEIQQSLPWTVKDLVTISPTDIVADYIDNPIKQGPLEKISVFVSNRSLISPLIDVVNQSDAPLALLTCEEMIIASLVGQQSAANLIVCQEVAQEPSLLIVRDGCVLFSRRLRGFSRLSDMSLEDLAHGMLDSLSLEVQRSIDFFESQLKQPPLKSILIRLPSACLSDIVAQLGQYFPVKVHAFKSELPICQGHEEQYHFAIAAAAELIEGGDEESH